ncbi:MAG: transcription elongation factor GreA [Elusimicrobia bacterium]|nr:transcription elongation factor GreA [Candidatus Obscuribacterium magneticum]
MANIYMSRAGYEKLIKELESLRQRKIELSKEIGEAREQGDLRENAGYHYARERQSETLRRMAEIQERLIGAKIIEELNLPKGEVIIGMKVTIQEMGTSDDYEYTLVGAEEADPAVGKISVHAPIAQGLLGHKVNDEVDIQLPAGKSSFKILKIEPNY